MTNCSSIWEFSLHQRSYSRWVSKTSPYLQTIPFVLPQVILLVCILQTYCLWTTSPFINWVILSFHTIFCSSKFQRFTTYCIKKLFLLSVLNKPNATFIVSLLLLLHDVLNNISTFSSPNAFAFCKYLWYHTSDSWIVPVFQFPFKRQPPHHPDRNTYPSFYLP